LDPANFAENASKHVILYGACSHMGQTCARVMLKYGYSLILVDANLHKL
jgi:short-subunit dehydrogenase